MQHARSIGVLGLGTIASALVQRIAADGHRITVSTRSAINSARLAEQLENVVAAENQGVVDASDVVFLGMTGDAAPDILGQLRFRDEQKVISLMAEQSFAATAKMVAPAKMVTRMIPFPTIAAAGSPILTCGDSALIDLLFGARNPIFALANENELSKYLCAQAVLSPVVSMVSDAAGWLAVQGVSDADKAQDFLRALVGTSLLGARCDSLLQALDTPGGYNRRLRQHMHNAGMAMDLRKGLDSLSE